MPGTKDNTNAVKHGLRASKLPPGNSYISAQTTRLRRFCRELIIARDGECGVYAEAVLQSCLRHETRAQLASKWLRDEGDKLDLEARLKLLDTISKATDSRDKCLEKLKLDAPANSSDPWADLIIPVNPQSSDSNASHSNPALCVDGDSSMPASDARKSHDGDGGIEGSLDTGRSAESPKIENSESINSESTNSESQILEAAE